MPRWFGISIGTIRRLCMESQEGHNPDLDWRGKSAKPYGFRTVSVRFGKNSVRNRTDSVRF